MTKTKQPIQRTPEQTKAIEKFYTYNLKKWPVTYKEHYVKTTFGITFVLECGTSRKPPLFLLHGAGGTSCMWFKDIKTLSENFHVFAVDIIGDQGRSVMTYKVEKPEMYGQWMEELLNHFSLKKINLVGMSLGASYTAYLGSIIPHRLIKTVCLAPAYTICKTPLKTILKAIGLALRFNKKNITRFLHYSDAGKLDTNDEWMSRVIDFMAETMVHQRATLMTPYFTDREVKDYKIPCTCYLAELDPWYNALKVKKRFDSLGGNIKIKTVQGEGHMMDFRFSRFILEELT